jgi:hypothetical protein
VLRRNLLILVFCATITVLLGDGYYAAFRSGVLRTIGYRRAYHRDREPIRYWIGMIIGTFGFLVLASATAVMAFLVCVDLFGL